MCTECKAEIPNKILQNLSELNTLTLWEIKMMWCATKGEYRRSEERCEAQTPQRRLRAVMLAVLQSSRAAPGAQSRRISPETSEGVISVPFLSSQARLERSAPSQASHSPLLRDAGKAGRRTATTTARGLEMSAVGKAGVHYLSWKRKHNVRTQQLSSNV